MVTSAGSAEKNISRCVITLRKKKNMSQAALAKLSGLSRKTVNGVESGMKNRLLVQTLVQLAVALEVTPNDLLDWKFSGSRHGTVRSKKKSTA